MLPKGLVLDYSRKKIESVIKNAIANKPQDCTNIRIIDKKVYNSEQRWYENNIFARYNTEKGQIDLEIEKTGDWTTTEPANYILYKMGEYTPFCSENFFTIQGFYESDLDSGIIDKPIQGVISPKWEIKQVCEEIIKQSESIDNVEFILWFDESELSVDRFDKVDYRYNWSDLQLKQYYCSKITIEYGEKTYTTKGGFYSEYISWINKCANALKNHNIDYTVSITDEDYQKWCKFHNWNDLEFEDPRFNL